MIVVDDASTDSTRSVLDSLSSELGGSLETLSNPRNRGRVPSVMTAYERALETDPDYVLQVDGDGQFHGGDLRGVLVPLMDDAHAVSGVRRFRVDPWFRMTFPGQGRTGGKALAFAAAIERDGLAHGP